ncbi:MAG: YncE family protein [Gemmatimonadota bacterium]
MHPKRLRYALLGAVSAGLTACAGAPVTPSAPAPADRIGYTVYVASESSDLVTAVEFDAATGARVARDIPVGIMPGDIDGAHGLQASLDGRFWYLSIAHGQPFGTVWKFDADADTLVGRTEVGMFPATMGITPDGEYLFVVNFNLHGDPDPSTVSVVHTPTMTELARPVACVRPHGSRVNAAGTKNYVACVGSDQIAEIDTRTFDVTGRFSVAPGREGVAAGEGIEEARGSDCGPTWVTPGVASREGLVYVPCNKLGQILEIDVREWRVVRRFPTGAGPYNLEITPDGSTLVASLKGAQAVAIFDLEAGAEAARLGTSQPLTHGVAISPDGRFAFVSSEAIGATPGTLDVFDLPARARVASVELGLQAGGIVLVRER